MIISYFVLRYFIDKKETKPKKTTYSMKQMKEVK